MNERDQLTSRRVTVAGTTSSPVTTVCPTWLSVAEDFEPVEANVPELMEVLARPPRFSGCQSLAVAYGTSTVYVPLEPPPFTVLVNNGPQPYRLVATSTSGAITFSTDGESITFRTVDTQPATSGGTVEPLARHTSSNP